MPVHDGFRNTLWPQSYQPQYPHGTTSPLGTQRTPGCSSSPTTSQEPQTNKAKARRRNLAVLQNDKVDPHLNNVPTLGESLMPKLDQPLIDDVEQIAGRTDGDSAPPPWPTRPTTEEK